MKKWQTAITNPRTAENYSAQHIGQDKYKIIYHNRGGFALKQIENKDGIPVIFRVNEMASQVQNIVAPEVMAQDPKDVVDLPDASSPFQTEFTTAEDPSVEKKPKSQKPVISAAFGSALERNKKQTEKAC